MMERESDRRRNVAGTATGKAADEAGVAREGDEQGESPPLNREQRRAQRFGRHHEDARDELFAQLKNNPAFGQEDDDTAYTGRPDQDATHHTGPGTGGATESADRLSHHEGTHAGNQGSR